MHPIDWQIISILQEDGKTTYGELAKRVGLSQAAAHERVKKLEARGFTVTDSGITVVGKGVRVDA